VGQTQAHQPFDPPHAAATLKSMSVALHAVLHVMHRIEHHCRQIDGAWIASAALFYTAEFADQAHKPRNAGQSRTNKKSEAFSRPSD
jgi:hypothetical protein